MAGDSARLEATGLVCEVRESHSCLSRGQPSLKKTMEEKQGCHGNNPICSLQGLLPHVSALVALGKIPGELHGGEARAVSPP